MAEQERAVLFGGPLDGLTTAPRTLPFIWVGMAGSGVRVYDKRSLSHKRLLYRREDGQRYVFAGDTHAICEKCENPQEKGAECRLCGAKLIPA